MSRCSCCTGCCTSTRRVQGAHAHFRSANAPAPGSCDDVRSSSPARWHARPDWPTDCAPEVCAAADTFAVSCLLQDEQLVVILLTCSGICALSFVWQPVHVSRTRRVAGFAGGANDGAATAAAPLGRHGAQTGTAPAAAALAPAEAAGGGTTGAMSAVSPGSECAGEGGNDGGGGPAGCGTLAVRSMAPDCADDVPIAAAGGATAGGGAPGCATEESLARLAAASCRAAPSGSSSRWM